MRANEHQFESRIRNCMRVFLVFILREQYGHRWIQSHQVMARNLQQLALGDG